VRHLRQELMSTLAALSAVNNTDEDRKAIALHVEQLELVATPTS
jgi:hypothetical protein